MRSASVCSVVAALAPGAPNRVVRIVADEAVFGEDLALAPAHPGRAIGDGDGLAADGRRFRGWRALGRTRGRFCWANRVVAASKRPAQMNRRFMVMLSPPGRAHVCCWEGPDRNDCRTARPDCGNGLAIMRENPVMMRERKGHGGRRHERDGGSALSRGARGREAAAGGGRDQRLRGAHGRGDGLPRDLSLRRRRGGQLAGHARPGHQHHGRRADRRAAHHRRLPRCRCWSTSTPAGAGPSTSRAPFAR